MLEPKQGFRRHLTYANVMVTLLAFIVLSGGVAVAANHLVGTKQIKNGAVTTKKLKNRAVNTKKLRRGAVRTPKLAGRAVKAGKIAPKAVGAAKIADGAVGGLQADEESFEGVLKGDGRLVSGAASAAANNGVLLAPPFPVLVEIPGFGHVDLIGCRGSNNAGDNNQMRVRMLSSDDSEPFLAIGNARGANLPPGSPVKPAFIDSSAGQLGGGGGSLVLAQGQNPTAGAAGHFEWQLSRGTGDEVTGARIEVMVHNTSTPGTLGQCHAMAQAVIQE